MPEPAAMPPARQRWGLLAAALWWGSLTAVGAWVVPLLFGHLPTPTQAGQVAARLFAAQTWVALGCGVFLLMSFPRGRLEWGQGAVLLWVVGGMLLALLSEHAIAPRIVARENLALWHGAGTAAFAAQWVCAGLALWKLSGRPVSPGAPS